MPCMVAAKCWCTVQQASQGAQRQAATCTDTCTLSVDHTISITRSSSCLCNYAPAHQAALPRWSCEPLNTCIVLWQTSSLVDNVKPLHCIPLTACLCCSALSHTQAGIGSFVKTNKLFYSAADLKWPFPIRGGVKDRKNDKRCKLFVLHLLSFFFFCWLHTA